MVCLFLLGSLPFTSPAPGTSPFTVPTRCPLTAHTLSIRPQSTIPICLDLGTNNQKLLDDPLYLGLRQKRPSPEETAEFVEEFMHEMHKAFPRILVQFEDFSTDNAFKFLEQYRARPSTSPVFNDDIQVRASSIHLLHNVRP